MARQIVRLEGLIDHYPCFKKWQVYKMVRDPVNPLPHKKAGKTLLFDLDRIDHWFDRLPGRDAE